jgi:hypothetical protein
MLLDRTSIEQTGRNLAKQEIPRPVGWHVRMIISSVVAINSKHFPPRLQQ